MFIEVATPIFFSSYWLLLTGYKFADADSIQMPSISKVRPHEIDFKDIRMYTPIIIYL